MKDYDRLYRATSYVVHAPSGSITLRIGRQSAALDELLALHGAGTAVFITAWNPGSRQCNEEENRVHNETLAAEIARTGCPVLPGEGVGDDGEWAPEESFLVIGMAEEEALALGRLHGQNAVVFLRAGSPPALLWC